MMPTRYSIGMAKIREWIARSEAGLKWIPERTAQNLLRVLGYYATILYAVMLLCHAVFRGGFTFRSMVGLASYAMLASIAAGLGFWLNRKLFFSLFSSGLACGAVYMLVVLIFNTAPGWSDAASLLGFSLVVFLGMVMGISAEYVKYLLKPKLDAKLE